VSEPLSPEHCAMNSSKAPSRSIGELVIPESLFTDLLNDIRKIVKSAVASEMAKLRDVGPQPKQEPSRPESASGAVIPAISVWLMNTTRHK
jgi:hypothetical protein